MGGVGRKLALCHLALALALAGLSACKLLRGERKQGAPMPLPAPAAQYRTEARPHGVLPVGPAEQLHGDVVRALAERGEHPSADGALRDTASWALNELYEGRPVDGLGIEAASKRFGFAGVTVTSSVFELAGAARWRERVLQVPTQQRLARYGVSVSPKGDWAAVVFGSSEVTYGPLARAFKAGQILDLKGEVDSVYASSELFLAKPDGTIEERAGKGRAFEGAFSLLTPGIYQLEVVGDGATGPVVLSNVPIYVETPEPLPRSTSGEVLSAEAAEAQLFTLLNDARRAAQLQPLQQDNALREVALAHSTDMVRANFFGHVSPTTGTTAARVERSGLLFSKVGENVASVDTAEAAHRGLMGSPGHRANMLRPDFTHVGIGVRAKDGGLVATLLFGRKPDPLDFPSDAGRVETALQLLRDSKGLPSAKSDALYGVAADAGAAAFASGADTHRITKAAEAALGREVQRLQASRPATCIVSVKLLETAQLEDVGGLASPTLKRFGVGARVELDARGTRRLATVFVLEDSAPCE